MSKLFNALVREQVRQAHVENIARSADNPTIKHGMAFTKGFKAPWPAASDLGRRVRRKLERQMLKQLKD